MAIPNTLLMVYHATQRNDRVSRLLAERGFELEWVNPARGEMLPDDIDGYFAAVVYGGAHSVNDAREDVVREQRWIDRWIADERPYLGLCLGSQFLARSLGATVGPAADNSIEKGYTRIEPAGDSGLVNRPMYVFEWHNEGYALPEGCTPIAGGRRFPTQAYRYRPWIVGFQFHPEVVPEIAFQWYAEAGEHQLLPQAHLAERQLRDAQIFEPGLEQWTRRFLDDWIDHSMNYHNRQEKDCAHG